MSAAQYTLPCALPAATASAQLTGVGLVDGAAVVGKLVGLAVGGLVHPAQVTMHRASRISAFRVQLPPASSRPHRSLPSASAVPARSSQTVVGATVGWGVVGPTVGECVSPPAGSSPALNALMTTGQLARVTVAPAMPGVIESLSVKQPNSSAPCCGTTKGSACTVVMNDT